MVNNAFTIWLTGLSGSGKSTIATVLEAELLTKYGNALQNLDGDRIRTTINRDLGYSPAERHIASERIAHVARLLNDNDIVCLVSNITQNQSTRKLVRGIIGNFILVFIQTPLEECQRRDPKGNYRKACQNELDHFVGIHEPYQAPCNAEVTIDTLSTSPEQAVQTIVSFLENNGWLNL